MENAGSGRKVQVRTLLGSVTVIAFCTACTLLVPAYAAIPATDAQSIIICPASYATAANTLSSFHVNTEGIPSTVVTVEDIAANYAAAPNPPFHGYSDNSISGWENPKKDYNFTLAKQIVTPLTTGSAGEHSQGSAVSCVF